MAALLLLAAGALPAQVPAGLTLDDFFDSAKIQELRFDIRPSDWAQLKANYLDNTYYPVDFHWIVNGKDVALTDVAIRSRGRGSRSPIKPNLRIDFNRFDPDQEFLGITSAVLKANNQDASMLKERSVFRLFHRLGLPASRQAPCRVYINNEYLGLFLLTEEIRSQYTKHYLGEGSGDLYKYDPFPVYHFEWRPTCAKADEVACSTDPVRWAPAPMNPEENKATYDIVPLINFIRTINEASDADFPAAVEKVIDPKLFLNHIAFENYVADYDSILGDVFGMNNFFIYRYKDGTYEFLLWDKDASYDYAKRDIFQNRDQNVLSRRLMAIPQRKAEYLDAMYKAVVLAGGAGGWLEWLNRQNYSQIKEAVYADTNKQYSDFGVEKPSTNEVFEAQVVTNQTFVTERAAFVWSALAEAGFAPSTAVTLAERVVNEAQEAVTSISPGAVIELTGSGFGEQSLEASADKPVTKLGTVSVIVNGFEAQVLTAAPDRIRIKVPAELGAGSGTAPITVVVAGPTNARGTRAGSPINSTFSNTIKVAVVIPPAA
ncbi:MAG: CotH kinase family protein [Acidobacteria bacterium]|nr:CotH kinase family protein [Acidobacteriota bacterium]